MYYYMSFHILVFNFLTIVYQTWQVKCLYLIVAIYGNFTYILINAQVKQRSRALSEDEGVGLEGGGALLREHPRLEVRSSHPVGMTASPEVDLWSSMMTSHVS